MAGRINIRIDESTLVLAPGGAASIEVWITNAGGVVDSFNLSVVGLDPTWYSLTGDAVSLFPDQSNGVTLTVQPPAIGGAIAGNYPFSLVATSVDDPTESSSAALMLQLMAIEDLAIELTPQRVAGRKGLYNIELVNPGNKAYPVVLAITDADEALRYTVGTPEIHNKDWSQRDANMPGKDIAGRSEVILGKPEATGDGNIEHELEVPPGGSAIVPLMVAPIKRIWTGKEKLLAFEVRSHPPGVEWDPQQARITRGELAYRPILAMWYGLPRALRAALPIIMGLVFLGVLLWLLFKPADKPIVPVVDVPATLTAVAQGKGDVSATLTALAKANAGDSAAATMTALAILNGNGTNGNGDNGSGAVGPSADGVPDIRRFWLEIPTSEPVLNTQGQPNLQYDITAAESVVITPTTRESSLTGFENSMIIDYELTAVGEKGVATNTISVLLIRPPSIGLLVAEPMTITLGESSSIQWTVQGGRSTTLDGTLVDTSQPSPDGLSKSGGISVTPSETHKYKFCATNDAGQSCQEVTVWVIIPATATTTPTETPTETATSTTTSTSVPSTFTSTPTNKPTDTALPTGAPTNTKTNTPTKTPLAPTNTPPPIPPSSTPSLPPTFTHTSTPTNTPLPFTYTSTTTPTSTYTTQPTFTSTPTYTATETHTETPMPMATACATYVPLDVPKRIYGDSIVNVTSHGIISDINVLDLHFYASPYDDVFEVSLESPAGFRPGIRQYLTSYRCNDENAPYEIQIDLDDQAEAYSDNCNPDRAYGSFKPDNPLSIFNGLDAYGTWTLVINDPRMMGEPGTGSTIFSEISPLQQAPTPTRTPRGGPTSTPTRVPPPRTSILQNWVLEICFTNGQIGYYAIEGR